jgi:UDP-glucose 4-epimerase
MQYQREASATHDIIYGSAASRLSFHLGDVRDLHAVAAALRHADIAIYAAALKQVPSCEYAPYEAVMTNILGAENVVRAIREFGLPVQTVVGVSTDKAVNPVNVMGMTKALQERIFARANLDLPNTRFIVVRYGNVLASRGSMIPLFLQQIRAGGPVTVTHPDMTRFLLSLHDAVDVIFHALAEARAGETYVPRLKGARVMDVARVLIGDRPVAVELTGVRPGEKLHEFLVSDEESHRTAKRGRYFVVSPILPELGDAETGTEHLAEAYCSNADMMDEASLGELLRRWGLLEREQQTAREGELLR